MSDLIKIIDGKQIQYDGSEQKLDPEVIFSNEEADKIISQITEKVNEFVPDTSTVKGRKEISTNAAKIAKAKVLIDEMRKDLVSGWKKKSKAVDVVGKKIRDSLDGLKLTYRAPLTKWENDDKQRIATHEEAVAEIKNTGIQARDNWHSIELGILEKRLSQIESKPEGEVWEEFAHDATVAKFEAVSLLQKAITQRKAADAKDAELEKFRAQQAEDDRKRFEANQQLETDKAAREIALKETSRLEEEKNDAVRRAQEAEQDAAKVKKEAEDNAFKEVEAKQAKEKAEATAREADTKHRGKINREAMEALVLIGMDKEIAKTVIKAIARKIIPNVVINY